MALLVVRSLNFTIANVRSLFSDSYLGIAGHKKRAAAVISDPNTQVFKKQMENCLHGSNYKILSKDLKKLIYAINDEDLDLFAGILNKYADYYNSSSNDSIKFQQFNFGPEIMRVYHIMNKPHEAFSLLQDPKMVSFVNNKKSLFILQDLLYNNELYEEVCRVFDIVQRQQFSGRVFHVEPYVLYQAACYKMNTHESYNNIMKSYEQYIRYCRKPVWPILMYTLMATLNNDSVELPLKHANGNDPAAINIRLTALIKSGDYSGALDFFHSLNSKSVVTNSIVEQLKNFGTVEDEHVRKSWENLKKEIDGICLQKKTLDELAADCIHSFYK